MRTNELPVWVSSVFRRQEPSARLKPCTEQRSFKRKRRAYLTHAKREPYTRHRPPKEREIRQIAPDNKKGPSENRRPDDAAWWAMRDLNPRP